jgi:hypothetical protein
MPAIAQYGCPCMINGFLIQYIDGGVRCESSSKPAQAQASWKEAREESDFASSWSEVGAVISSISSIKPCKNTVLSNIRIVYDRLIRLIYTHQAHDIMVQLLRSK